MDYKEQIEQAKHAAEKWREKHRIVGVGEFRVDCMVDDLTRSITDLLARAEAAEARCETLEKMVKEYQDTIVPGYRERAEKAERKRDEFKAKYIEAVNRACELSKIVDDHGWEE